jgi:uncharacterized BrkB/YihY/UPF0761 family membrane protein
MGQIIKLLVIVFISSIIYVFYKSITNTPKTDLGFFIASVLGIVIWMIIKNLMIEAKRYGN